jgi:hypothetical protein
MIEKNNVYNLVSPVKGWPVREAETLEEASQVILGSPYWQIPEDTYKIIDKNETYSLLAVYKDGRISLNKRYLALNMKLVGHIEPFNS